VGERAATNRKRIQLEDELKKSKIVGAAVAVVLSAGVFAAISPSADAVVTSVGSCGDMKGVGSLKSTTINPVTGKGYGITDVDNQDITVSVKGVDPAVNKGLDYGDCTFASGLSTPDGQKPVNKGYTGTKAITKWSSKLFSPEADCNTQDTTDLTEWPINGAFSVQLDTNPITLKANKMTINITVDGFSDPDNDPLTPSDVVEGRGLVTKGVAAGADTTFGVYFEPVLQDKAQTTSTPYFGYNFDLAAAVGCTDPTASGADPGNTAVNANITSVVIGDGTSLLLGLPASGIDFTFGQP
jgi:hypothetical protein